MKPIKRKRGRQVKYKKKDMLKIIAAYANSSLGLPAICGKNGLPDRSTFYDWLEKFPDLADKFNRAQLKHMEHMMYETLPIADDGRNDYFEDHKGNIKVDHEHVLRSKLRVETRLRLVAALTALRENAAKKDPVDSAKTTVINFYPSNLKPKEDGN